MLAGYTLVLCRITKIRRFVHTINPLIERFCVVFHQLISFFCHERIQMIDMSNINDLLQNDKPVLVEGFKLRL
jgi:hypothetical protein